MKAYKVIKSNIHRKGLCATRNIKRGKRIIEYRGKKITHKQALTLPNHNKPRTKIPKSFFILTDL